MKSKSNNILSRLLRVYKEFSNVRCAGPDSRMCEFWEDPTIEILEDSTELNALEIEFGIEFDEDDALDIYDMSVEEAAKRIKEIVREQSDEEYSPMQIIEEITPENAKRILQELWKENIRNRDQILTVIEKLEYEDKAGKKKRKRS